MGPDTTVILMSENTCIYLLQGIRQWEEYSFQTSYVLLQMYALTNSVGMGRVLIKAMESPLLSMIPAVPLWLSNDDLSTSCNSWGLGTLEIPRMWNPWVFPQVKKLFPGAGHCRLCSSPSQAFSLMMDFSEEVAARGLSTSENLPQT